MDKTVSSGLADGGSIPPGCRLKRSEVMYVVLRDDVFDSAEFADKIEKNSEFKIIKDYTKSTKREDCLAYMISFSIKNLGKYLSDEVLKELENNKGFLNGINEDTFIQVMKENDESLKTILDLMPKYTIMEARGYKLDDDTESVISMVVIANIDIGRMRLAKIIKRMMGQVD